VNTREVFKPALNCTEGFLDFLSLRNRCGPRYCTNGRREFTSYPMRQFLEQQSHGTLRIAALPKIGEQSWRSFLHTL
jgi:hypothetical protein